MAFGNFFSGTDPSVRQAPTLTPQQQQTSSQLLGLMPQLQQSFNFEPIAEAAQQRFQQQTMPGIAERFGGMQAKRSSGFNQATANAYRDLQTNLAAQQSKFGIQSQGHLAQLLGLGMKPQFENIYEPGEESPFGSFLGQALPAALHGGAAFLSGGATLPFTAAMYGGGVGDLGFSKLFGGGGGGGRGGGPAGGPTTQTQGVQLRGGGNVGVPYSNAPQYGFGGRKGRQWSL